jgi:hypothetical protein
MKNSDPKAFGRLMLREKKMKSEKFKTLASKLLKRRKKAKG